MSPPRIDIIFSFAMMLAVPAAAQLVDTAAVDGKLPDHFVISESLEGQGSISMVLDRTKIRKPVGLFVRDSMERTSPFACIIYNPRSSVLEYVEQLGATGSARTGRVSAPSLESNWILMQLVRSGNRLDLRGGAVRSSQSKPHEVLQEFEWIDSKPRSVTIRFAARPVYGALHVSERDRDVAIAANGSQIFTGAESGFPKSERFSIQYTYLGFLIALIVISLVIYDTILRHIDRPSSVPSYLVLILVQAGIIGAAIYTCEELSRLYASAFVPTIQAIMGSISSFAERIFSTSSAVIPGGAVLISLVAAKFVEFMVRASRVADARKKGLEDPEEVASREPIPEDFPELDPSAMVVRSSTQLTQDFYRFQYRYPELKTPEFTYDLRRAEVVDGRLHLLNGVQLEFRQAP